MLKTVFMNHVIRQIKQVIYVYLILEANLLSIRNEVPTYLFDTSR